MGRSVARRGWRLPLFGVLLLLAVSLSLAGCGGGGSEGAAEEDTVEYRVPGHGVSVRVPSSWDAVDTTSSAEELVRFQDEHPKYPEVEFVHLTFRLFDDALLTAEPGGSTSLLVTARSVAPGLTLRQYVRDTMEEVENQRSSDVIEGHLDGYEGDPMELIVKLPAGESWRLRLSSARPKPLEYLRHTLVQDGYVYLFTYSTLRPYEQIAEIFDRSSDSIRIVPPESASSTRDYEATELVGLGGESAATAINDEGEVVGSSFDDTGEPLPGKPSPGTVGPTLVFHRHAVLWLDGTVTDLGTLGSGESSATAINDEGQIVGSSETASGEEHAFLWKDGEITDLGTLGGGSSSATAINDEGQIVGSSETASGEEHAFLWEDGEMTDLEIPAGEGGGAMDINNRGQVVGVSAALEDSLDFRAFLWEDGEMIDLGTLAGQPTMALSINDGGQVVGFGGIFPPYRAFLWEDGKMIDLGALDDHSSSAAFGINDQGQIVGISGPETDERAVIFEVSD